MHHHPAMGGGPALSHCKGAYETRRAFGHTLQPITNTEIFIGKIIPAVCLRNNPLGERGVELKSGGSYVGNCGSWGQCTRGAEGSLHCSFYLFIYLKLSMTNNK